MYVFFEWIIRNLKEILPIAIVPETYDSIVLLVGRVWYVKKGGGFIFKVPYIMSVCSYPNRVCYASSTDLVVSDGTIVTTLGEMPVCRTINVSARYVFTDILLFARKHGLRNGVENMVGISPSTRDQSHSIAIILEAPKSATIECIKHNKDLTSANILEYMPVIEGIKFEEVFVISDCRSVSIGFPKLQDYTSGS